MRFNFASILKMLNGREKILDIGCGTGRFTELDRERIVGIDTNPAYLKICKEKGLSVRKMSATRLKFKDSSFDAIVTLSVIEHLDIISAYKLLKESYRVLKKGGIMIILSPEFTNKRFWSDFSHIKPYTVEAMKNFIESKQKIDNFPPVPFKIIGIWYEMRGFPGRGLPFVEDMSNVIANKINFRRHDYLMILKK